MNPGYTIRKNKLRRRWWVTLVATNGQILSHSEQLNSHQAALENIEAQRKAARSMKVTDDG